MSEASFDDSTIAFPKRPGIETLSPLQLEVGDEPEPYPLPSSSIGPYRLIEILGEGGMGTVYLAEQTEPLARRVALKLIRSGQHHRKLLRRFEAERQALARMSHPFIAQVYEAGASPEGQPYIAMELVPGLPITDYCDRKRLTFAERLELFAGVCDGVQHAHQKAVLHRDLKPSNVLVMESEGRPVPKIIDFGVAKALDHPLAGTMLTADHMVVGTAAYMSPEAITAGPKSPDLDTRADVYALGVVLYELLVGARPFDGPNSLEAMRLILEGDLERPSDRWASLEEKDQKEAAEQRRLDPAALRRALRGDLDAIVLKATARERSQRYGSAAELAADVRRHLAHEPVLAAPPGAFYQTGKFIRRHRFGVAATAVIALLLVGGFVARSLEARRANREAAASRQVAAFLASLFDQTGPTSQERRDLTARQILDDGARRVRTELDDQPLIKAQLMLTIGNVYRELGAYDQAGPLLEESLAIRRKLLEPEDGEVAESLRMLGAFYRESGQPERALPLLREAIRIEETKGGESLPLAGALLEMSNVQKGLGRYEDGEKLLLRVLAIRERELGPEHEEVAAALNNLANIYFAQRRYGESEKLQLRSIAIKEKTLGPSHYHLAQSLNNLSNVYVAQSRFAEAEALQRRALAIKRKSLPPGHLEIAVSLNNLGTIFAAQGRLAEAEALELQGLAIQRRSLPAHHADLGINLYNLGDIAYQQGRLAVAAERFREAREIWRTSLPPNHPYQVLALGSLANAERDLERYGEAEPLYREALQKARTIQPADPAQVQTLEKDYEALLRATGRKK